VLSHVAANGRVTIDAQVPRRMLDRLRKDHTGVAAVR
jgi:hypothetical protein